jgi:hypothetical protein
MTLSLKPSSLTPSTLKPHVTREEAIAAFQRGGGLFRQDALRSVADVYVPYHLFRVEIVEPRRQQTSYVAVDALRGMLDPYQFDRCPEGADLVTIDSRNRMAATLDIETASRVVVDAVRRILFQTGVYRLRAPRIDVRHEPLELHVPYYLGFYGSTSTDANAHHAVARLRVMDAVRRRFEGGKARALFEAWLAD